MGGTRHIMKSDYVKDHDSASAFTSPIVKLDYPLDGIYYQFVWDVGVRGQFLFEVSIMDDYWETLEDCSPVSVGVSTAMKGSKIVAIPQAWFLVSKLRFRWIPDQSKGLINVALRITPR